MNGVTYVQARRKTTRQRSLGLVGRMGQKRFGPKKNKKREKREKKGAGAGLLGSARMSFFYSFFFSFSVSII